MDLLKSAKGVTEPPAWIYQVDVDFHEMIASFANNAFFLQAIQNQNRLRRLMEFRGYSNRRRIADWCHEHLAIIDALERGQVDRAAELMRTHLDAASDMAKAVSKPRRVMK